MAGNIYESLNTSEDKFLVEVSESLKLQVQEQEDDSVVDGVNVLARVVGPAFFPDRISGNKVRYTRSLWDSVLNDERVQKLLGDNIMFGTIGHEIVHLTDVELRQGIPSHITIRMWIDENGIGMAEHLILNTPTGRVLNTVLRAGSKIKVSTRALGSLSNPDKNGVKDVDEFDFQRVDFVIFPGFEEAAPEIKESLNSTSGVNDHTDNLTTNKEEDMSEVTIEFLQKQLEEKDKKIAELEAKLDSKAEKQTEVSESLAAYKVFGTPSDIKESLAAYQKLGTPEKISESLDEATAEIEKTREELEEAEEQLKEVTAERDRLLADAAADLNAETEVNEELKAYRELGTVAQINEAMDFADKLIADRKKLVAESLSRKFKVSRPIVEALLEDKGVEEVEELLSENAKENTDPVHDPDQKPEETEVTFETDPDQNDTIGESGKRPANMTAGKPAEKTIAEALGATNSSRAANLLRRKQTLVK